MELDKQVELKARQLIDEEVVKYRQFLQLQFKHIAWLIGIIAIVGATLFVWLVGQTKDSIFEEFKTTKNELLGRINQKFVQYKFDEKLSNELSSKMKTAVDLEITDSATREKIQALVEIAIKEKLDDAKNQLDQKTEEIVSKYEDVIATTAEKELEKLPQKPKELLQIVSIPPKAVVALDSDKCPDGWKRFHEASGRTIIGSGKGNGLSPRKRGTTGGEERHTLRIEELPSHDHGTRHALSGTSLAWGPGSHPIPTSSARKGSEKNWRTGGSAPHENMPPFIVLTYCQRT